MLLYSQIWDALLKLITLVAAIILAVRLKLDDRLGSGVLMVAVAAIVWAIVYRQFVSILSSWLYARVNLGTPVTFGEAAQLRRLFQLDVSGKWIPMTELKRLPAEGRHDALLQALEKHRPARKAMLI